MTLPQSPFRNPAVIGAALLMALTACGTDPVVEGIIVQIEVSPRRDTLAVGSSVRLQATALNAERREITGANILWTSRNPIVASVDSLTGLVSALEAGETSVVARAGSVADSALIRVVPPVTGLVLPLDTILLVTGDTITIPSNVLLGFPVETLPSTTFTSDNAAIATIDSVTGLVTATGPGRTGFTVRADTLTARGAIEVLTLPDTANGALYMSLSTALPIRIRMASRSFNQPTDDGRTVFTLNALSQNGDEQFAILSIDTIVGTGVTSIGQLRFSDLGIGADPVCRPPGNWAFYVSRAGGANDLALSQQGTLTITSFQPVTGGSVISGRFDITVLRVDAQGGTIENLTALGTFVIPVVSLATCPK